MQPEESLSLTFYSSPGPLYSMVRMASCPRQFSRQQNFPQRSEMDIELFSFVLLFSPASSRFANLRPEPEPCSRIGVDKGCEDLAADCAGALRPGAASRKCYPEKRVFLRIRLIRRNLARRRQNSRRTPPESKKSDFPQVRWRRRQAQNRPAAIEPPLDRTAGHCITDQVRRH